MYLRLVFYSVLWIYYISIGWRFLEFKLRLFSACILDFSYRSLWKK